MRSPCPQLCLKAPEPGPARPGAGPAGPQVVPARRQGRPEGGRPDPLPGERPSHPAPPASPRPPIAEQTPPQAVSVTLVCQAAGAGRGRGGGRGGRRIAGARAPPLLLLPPLQCRRGCRAGPAAEHPSSGRGASLRSPLGQEAVAGVPGRAARDLPERPTCSVLGARA